MRFKTVRQQPASLAVLSMIFLLVFPASAVAKGKKKVHPFDLYNHEMHTPIFEAVTLPCETCHADPDSYADRTKVNRLGCHTCHNPPDPKKAPLTANNDCNLCHSGGFPKPESHKAGWISKHQAYAKQDPKYCAQCHSDQIFCIRCHQRRDTVQERMHRRNFKLFHSIEARANPRKCTACHTVNFCQDCHAGRGTSKR